MAKLLSNIAGSVQPLWAITKNGKPVKISPKLIRKWRSMKVQRGMPSTNLCIVCSYNFYGKNLDWHNNIKAFCHPFRDQSFFPSKAKKFLLSESDMTDDMVVRHPKTDGNKKYDFIFFTLDSLQGVKCKGYQSIGIIDQAAKELGLRGLIVDYYHHRRKKKGKEKIKDFRKGTFAHQLERTREIRSNLKHVDFITKSFSQQELCLMMKSARFVMFANTRDASPRMITEALVWGCPIMVNKNIYGGWKYVNESNGILWDAPLDVFSADKKKDYYVGEMKKAMEYMSDTKFEYDNIRANYYSKYGLLNTEAKLAKILNIVDDTDRYLYVGYQFYEGKVRKRWKKHYDKTNNLRDIQLETL